ncbi:cobaltochelatase subunit CobN [Amycolatopsis alkalitolerans]|uniref:Cobaltochelatase subunit CobN n=1 Tax=Amycolatopsis alkalitolerans TaxID=2547244 RepID=A0A5C4LYA9_9PSEU|nr:cobaltochelatase subunit CobN [Amycolatopsis alkalitolerans]TNC24566.1 cobaltochelatase subunit CobN [Amycolatopsis alkalitolerans]
MILLLSTSDTDLLCARASAAGYRLGNPARLGVGELPALLEGVRVVVVRILGSARTWGEGLDAVRACGAQVVVLGGEQVPDAELMGLSTVPAGIATQAHAYLAQGGPENLTQLHRFLADTLLLTGEGFDPPTPQPVWGALDREPRRSEGPVVGIVYYRAHHLSGNTGFVEALAAAVEDAGGQAMPVYCASLRAREPEMMAALGGVDALLVTVLAAGGTRPSTVGAGGDEQAWDVAEMAALDIPILQALCLTSDRATWAGNDEGLSPLDAGNQMAVPEFDGRIITVPFSFKELDPDGLPRYVPDAERAARVARIAVAHARLRHTPPPHRRVALMLSAYPTKHSRVGNAVGLDTPASAVALLRRMTSAGYDLGESFPGVACGDGDELIHALIAAGGQDPDWLTEEQLAANPIRVPTARYRDWFAALPQDLRGDMERHWGPPPGSLYVDDGDIVLACLRAGNVVLMIQPPRGFGENPIAIYHNPDLPPSHHYLAAYRWLEEEFGAHAIVHLGKHGSLEWLPGKTAGLSASCAPDAVLGNLPLIYPFLINDPGEGAQAKRRAHATIIDHLIPPMARAESYGDLARLEQLMDEHANIAAMDPAKLPAIRAQIWTLIQAAKLDHDLGIAQRPHDAEFDEFLLHIDGWLCEIKDAQIRDGLHILGHAPTGQARVNLVLAMLRAQQMWGGHTGAIPGLRSALGLKDDAPLSEVDAIEQTARDLVLGMEAADWSPEAITADEPVATVLRFAATEIVPRLAGTSGELDAVLHALDGGYTPAGPSGSPLRGLINVLPTGRNFYTVDPRAIPSRLAWETGHTLADSLLRRYRDDTGDWPRSVGLSVWGTSAMRTGGDDAAEILALLGIQPLWDDASRRVTGLQPIPLPELGRPRIDVTVRISGFFRDAFPHVIDLLDDAVRLAATLDEPVTDNYVRAHYLSDLHDHGDQRRATTRIFGSKPGAYGAGLLPLMDSGTWRDDTDLAEVYATWGGYAYGRDLDGTPAREDMETTYRRITIAAKNTDTREHDIADSDDYYQYHGGMIAFTRALTGHTPASYIGDSTNPNTIRTRSLHEETTRVFRARVINPRWLAAMRKHGYKGAFELAATVDYLFGFDATTGVVDDWMYQKLSETYVLDQENQEFLTKSNPWALRGIIERLTEAADRGLWAQPDPELLDQLRQIYLCTEGNLEGD